MAKNRYRVISIILCLVLALSAAFACSVSAFAASGDTVYVRANNGWSTLYCYMWNSETDKNTAWPGATMTKLGDNIWMYSASKTFKNCIFNNGSTQTDDLVAQNGYIFDYSTGKWSVYDTSPLQVTSYEADPASDIYVDTDVLLSTTAKSTASSTIYYKISVTNSNGGTSVLKDFNTASSTVWTPSAVGTYTIKFEYKDGAGNENSRSLTLSVASDATLVKPVIKSVTPYNLNVVPTGSAATVKVKAGGGVTGTNLLFYKYIVTDPNGAVNTPYYTLSNTYTFTPSMVGNYKVDVYVQGSDNSTVSKTYTYVASGDAPSTTAPETAPETQPATQPTTAPDGLIKGDVDGDGTLSVKDATEVQKFVAHFNNSLNITLEMADMNDDGMLTVQDATIIQRMIAGLS